MACEFHRHHFPPRRGELVFRAHPLDLGIIGVGKDQAGVIGQQLYRKIAVHGPEEPVAPFQLALPLIVRHEIGPAGFTLDHPDLPLRAKGHHIHPQARGRHQLFHAHEVMSAKMAAHAAGQKLAGLKLIVHTPNMNNT